MRGLLFFCLLALVGLSTKASGAPPAPLAGVWDFVMSGDERGVAQIAFESDGPSSGVLRGQAFYTYFGPSTGIFTNRGVLMTNMFGGATLHGSWSYATPPATNRIVGFINCVSSPAGKTNYITNSFSFRGGLKGSRLTLLANGFQGEVTFRGIPLQLTNDLNGTYHGTGQKVGSPSPFIEVFELTPMQPLEDVVRTVVNSFECSTTNVTSTTNVSFTVDPGNGPEDCPITTITFAVQAERSVTLRTCQETNSVITTVVNPFPINCYRVTGGGPAYQYTGFFLLSRQGYAVFYQRRGDLSQLITTYAGPFNPITGRGTLRGTDGANRNISFSIYHGPR